MILVSISLTMFFYLSRILVLTYFPVVKIVKSLTKSVFGPIFIQIKQHKMQMTTHDQSKQTFSLFVPTRREAMHPNIYFINYCVTLVKYLLFQGYVKKYAWRQFFFFCYYIRKQRRVKSQFFLHLHERNVVKIQFCQYTPDSATSNSVLLLLFCLQFRANVNKLALETGKKPFEKKTQLSQLKANTLSRTIV